MQDLLASSKSRHVSKICAMISRLSKTRPGTSSVQFLLAGTRTCFSFLAWRIPKLACGANPPRYHTLAVSLLVSSFLEVYAVRGIRFEVSGRSALRVS
jgi:hypothetical protein